ncbi:MAG: hypothetical protein SGJ21_16290 [Alphaproteobacteria bacterium]|nr:hypothetical protein [Alphaproteobacteria bacterium]
MPLFRFEHHQTPMATGAEFAGRIVGNVFVALLIIGLALGGGMAGYVITEGMAPIDAFLNAAMLLGGMGPVTPLATFAGKIFAGVYALSCGLLLVFVTGVVLAPVLHRVLHALHVRDDR